MFFTATSFRPFCRTVLSLFSVFLAAELMVLLMSVFYDAVSWFRALI